MGYLRLFICALFFCAITYQGLAQVVRAGLKGGFQASWINYDGKWLNYNDDGKDYNKGFANITPVPGFNVGGILSFRVKDRFFLQTEYLYSTKGRKVTYDKNVENPPFEPDIRDRVVYKYLSVPVMFTIYFNANIGKNKRFKWFAGAGPSFNYWLGGKGVYYSESLEFEYNLPEGEAEYILKFGERGEDSDHKHVYYSNVNRMQIGLIACAGLLFEPAESHKVLLDLRYEIASTRLGNSLSNASYMLPPKYDETLKARNHTISLSLAYLFEFNTDKKVKNKGKSTIKKQKPTVKRRR